MVVEVTLHNHKLIYIEGCDIMATLGGSGNLSTDEIIINRTIRIYANTVIRELSVSSSRVIGTIEEEGEYLAELLKNNY